MGKAAITQVWLKQADDTGREKVEDERDKLLAEMNTAMEQKRPQSASQAFFEWEKTAKAQDDGKVTFKIITQVHGADYGLAHIRPYVRQGITGRSASAF